MNTIYCVEDDDSIRSLILYALESSGFSAFGYSGAGEFYAAVDECAPDLVLLDIMLPDTDGIKILKKLRSDPKTSDIAVIMLTAKGSESDKVTCFENGADDYITKPFGVMELISRIKAVLRRSNAKQDDSISINGITLDSARRTVTVDGVNIQVTYKEFELLHYLMAHKGRAVKRETLLNEIWGYYFEGESRTLDVHIGSLRKKLGDKGVMIETVRNVGYMIQQPV